MSIVTGRKMSITNPGRQIARDYEAMPPLHFLREAVQNSIQAGATKIMVNVDWLELQRRSKAGEPRALRLVIADNGGGMSGREMPELLLNLSASGGEFDDLNKFGVGVKTAFFPWNKAGLEFMSWKNGTGYRMLIVANEDGDPCIAQQEDEDGILQELMPAPEEYRKYYLGNSPNGTILICHGNAGTDNTFFGPTGEAALKGFAQYLNNRYDALPENVDLRVFEFTSVHKAQTLVNEPAGAPSGGLRRKVQGARYFLSKQSTFNEVVETPDCTVSLYRLKGSDNSNEVGNEGRGHKKVCVVFDNEVYEVHGPDTDPHHWTYYRAMGFKYSKASSDVSIVIEPRVSRRRGEGRTEGVHPNTSRSKLYFCDGTPGAKDLPYEAWGLALQRVMPERFENLIETRKKTAKPSGKDLQEKLRADAEAIVDLIKGQIFIAKPNGRTSVLLDLPGGVRTPATGEGGGTGGGGGTGTPTGVKKIYTGEQGQNESSGATGTVRARKTNKEFAAKLMPAVRMEDSEDLDIQMGGFPLRYDRCDNELVLNQRSPVFADGMAQLITALDIADDFDAQSKTRKLLEETAARNASVHIMITSALRKRGGKFATDFDKVVEETSLLSLAMGKAVWEVVNGYAARSIAKEKVR